MLKQVNGAPYTLTKQVTLLSIADQDLILELPQEKIGRFREIYCYLPKWASLYTTIRVVSLAVLKN